MASSMSFDDAKETLRKYRENQERQSEQVIDLWESVLMESYNKLGDELWLVYEQVYIASLDCGRVDITQMCLAALKAKFPSSSRVRKLEAMGYEAAGEDGFEEARLIYEELLTKDDTNSLIRKRLISILRSENKIDEAIKELNKYLNDFVMDTEAWTELADLYIKEQDYTKACYCMEELILSNPQNHLYFQRFAEIKYTQKGIDNLELARSYFSQALKLNPDNMRSLYGMFLASTSIFNQTKDKEKKKDNLKYSEWAARQISEKYQIQLSSTDTKAKKNQLKVVENMLKSLKINNIPST